MIVDEVDHLIRAAITGRRLVRFSFRGCVRIAEPHDYGIRDGVVQLLVYQVGGESRSGGLPQWRWIVVADMTALEVLDASFDGGRGDSVSRRSRWDELFLRVEARRRP
jgi:hypothetical protein